MIILLVVSLNSYIFSQSVLNYKYSRGDSAAIAFKNKAKTVVGRIVGLTTGDIKLQYGDSTIYVSAIKDSISNYNTRLLSLQSTKFVYEPTVLDSANYDLTADDVFVLKSAPTVIDDTINLLDTALEDRVIYIKRIDDNTTTTKVITSLDIDGDPSTSLVKKSGIGIIRKGSHWYIVSSYTE